MSVMEITQANFEEAVLKNPKKVLLDFWAPWCGPCRMVAPIVDEIAEENENIQVGKVNVDDEMELPLGEATLQLYPPLGEGDLNEQGLTVLCSAGNYDALITGDMAGSTEKKLVERYALPDIELLVVSHHGSKYATSRELLEAVTPETAVISVGDNSYGHPADEALLRLIAANCEIYRTDLQGHILLTVEGEE